MDSNLVKRVSFAAVAIPLALAIVWLGGWPLVVLVSIVCTLGVRELYDLAGKQGIKPAYAIGIATAALIPPAVYVTLTRVDLSIAPWWPYIGACWIILLLCWLLATRAPTEKPLPAAAVTLFGVLYAGALPAFVVTIRHGSHGLASWQGTWLVFFPLVFAGLVTMPVQEPRARERLTLALDSAVVMVVAVMAVWYLVIDPQVSARYDSTWSEVLTLAYPVGDLLLLFGVIRVMLRRPRRASVPSLRLLAAAFACMVLADVAFAHLDLEGSYETGSAPDALWVIAGLLAWIVFAIL